LVYHTYDIEVDFGKDILIASWRKELGRIIHEKERLKKKNH